MNEKDAVEQFNPYDILGVEETSSSDRIRSAYKALAKIHHPDAGGNIDNFRRIVASYEILSDPEKRQDYDDIGEITDVGVNKDTEAVFKMLSKELQVTLLKMASEKIPVDAINLMKMMKASLHEVDGVITGDIEEMHQVITSWKQLRKRTKFAGKNRNVMFETLDQMIKEHSKEMQEKKTFLRRLKRCITELEVYDSPVDLAYGLMTAMFGQQTRFYASDTENSSTSNGVPKWLTDL